MCYKFTPHVIPFTCPAVGQAKTLIYHAQFMQLVQRSLITIIYQGQLNELNWVYNASHIPDYLCHLTPMVEDDIIVIHNDLTVIPNMISLLSPVNPYHVQAGTICFEMETVNDSFLKHPENGIVTALCLTFLQNLKIFLFLCWGMFKL